MPANRIKLIAIISYALLLFTSAFAQQPQTSNQRIDSPWVEHTGFKGQIFEIKNRDPQELVQILYPLGSGFKGAMMQPNIESRIITVRDFPENIATIEEAIKRLDVPLAPKPPRPAFSDIEVYAYVLIASNDESAGAASPPVLTDLIKQFQATLNYKSYQLLTSIVQRTRYVNGSIGANGAAELPDKSLTGEYQLQIGNINPETRQSDSPHISLGSLRFSMRGYNDVDRRKHLGDASINTNLSVRDGEKLVVGTSSLRDKTIILVLTTKALK